MYSVLQAARYAGVSNSTIRNWSSDFGEFLSPGANPPSGKTREFTEDDLRVIATIAVMRSQLVETAGIRAALVDGQRLEPVRPPTEDTPPDDPASGQTAITIYKDLVDELQNRNSNLADRLIDAERRIADERERAARAEQEIKILREMYEAATNPTADRRPTFWQWLTSRK